MKKREENIALMKEASEITSRKGFMVNLYFLYYCSKIFFDNKEVIVWNYIKLLR